MSILFRLHDAWNSWTIDILQQLGNLGGLECFFFSNLAICRGIAAKKIGKNFGRKGNMSSS
jgi:hypothetical protein